MVYLAFFDKSSNVSKTLGFFMPSKTLDFHVFMSLCKELKSNECVSFTSVKLAVTSQLDNKPSQTGILKYDKPFIFIV